MSALAPLLAEITDALATAHAAFALVGGLAVSARTEPRFTRDIDVVVATADDAEAEALVGGLVPPYELLATLEHDALGRLASVRLARAGEPETPAVVDLLFASSGIEPEIAAAVDAIMQRGAARGRDLRGDWRRLVADHPDHDDAPETDP